VIPPAQFIPIAEATGLIDALGAQALSQACIDAHRWYAQRRVAVAVNVSGLQLRNPHFADTVMRILNETGLPAKALILELTEDALITELPDGPEVTQLQNLRENGVRIAIDDFGTGYSSLAYLSRLPVDIVKLDRSFASGGSTDDQRPGWAFTSAILEAISSLDLKVVAEGVETAEQADALRTLRCEFAQGYYFYRPMPSAAIDEILSVR
jgi:EAL domain-containing protein (putative c-di-GMP-specific phosphodiesterase class I)